MMIPPALTKRPPKRDKCGKRRHAKRVNQSWKKANKEIYKNAIKTPSNHPNLIVPINSRESFPKHEERKERAGGGRK